MPRPGKQGGVRQGTPGKSYSNRTDLNVTRAPVTATATPATGGYVQPGLSGPPPISVDQIPNLSDPTTRPNEPVTAGLDVGPGAGSEVLSQPGPQQPGIDPIRATIQAALLITENLDLVRILQRLDMEGR